MSSENSDQSKRPLVTGKLNADQRRAIIIPALGSFGTRFSSTGVLYHPVPFNYRTIQNPTPWRVLLKFGAPAPRAIVGLDIYGDVILGRGSDGPQSPDIDLSNLDALALGVSRRHALLRPTQNKLFLIDLDSTNGSYVNAIPVGRGMAQVLRSGDTVALAGLNFVVEVVRAPDLAKDPAEGTGEGQAESKPTTLTVGDREETRKESTASIPLPPMARPRQGQDTLPPGKVPRVDGELPPADSKKPPPDTGEMPTKAGKKAPEGETSEEKAPTAGNKSPRNGVIRTDGEEKEKGEE